MPDDSLTSSFRDQIAEQKANFLATISHELRTPMQSIYGLLELIQQQSTEPTMLDLTRAAQNSASLMLDLLDDILDFARLDANKLELEALEIPVRTLVQGVIEALSVRIGDRPITMHHDIADDVPVIILGDPKRLRQVLFNLVNNAIKFTESGSVTIRVTAAPETQLRFEVIDTGIGIEPRVQDKLFRPFSQGDSSTARKYGGTGLGLSICQKLVELMHGTIGVTSQPGAGSTFWFTIPYQIGDANNLDLTIDLSGLNILVVEDHPQGAAELDRSLRQMKANVVLAENLADARDYLQRQRFDVAIVDYLLPDGSGLELHREIAQKYPRTGQLMYTVHDHDGLQQELDSLGVDYLGKPASRQGLGQAVLDVAERLWRSGDDTPQRVLIAEDTESIRTMLRLQLEKLGVDADIVSDGEQALAMLKSQSYGLMLADLHMPKIDGYRLIHRLRATEEPGKRMPVIVLTADVAMAQRSVYGRYGFDDCLVKPATFNHLRHALERWGIRVQAAVTESEQTAPTPRALVDSARLAINMSASEKDAINLLQAFPKMCEPILHNLNTAFATDQLHDLAEAAHSLKGAARSACCDHLGDLAAALQDAVERKLPFEHLIPDINTVFAATCDFIRQQRP